MAGPWTVTASGGGWISQTRQVTLQSPAVARSGEATANFDLSQTSATVTGTVKSGGLGVGGAQVVMASPAHTYSALTATTPRPGSFQFSNVAPGHYLITFSLFGYQNEVVETNVLPGQALVVPTVQMPAVTPGSEKKAQIRGTVVDVSTGQPVTNGTASVEGAPSASAPIGPRGSYVIAGLGPGIHKVKVTAPGFDPVTVIVEVAQDSIADAPRALMPPLDQLTGAVRSNSGGVVPGAFVSLTPTPSSEKCGLASNPGLAPTAPTKGPGGSGRGCYAGPHGSYLILGLPHGNYTAVLESPDPPGSPNPAAPCAPGQSHPCGYYGSWATASGSVSLVEGQDQTRNFDMTAYGQLQVEALTPGPSGAMVPVASSITVTGPFTCSGAKVAYTAVSASQTAVAPCPTNSTAGPSAGNHAAANDAANASGGQPVVTSDCAKDGEVTEILSPAVTASVAQPVTFQGLPAGQYEICFGAARNSDGEAVMATANAPEVAVPANTTSTFQAVMLPASVTISGSLVYRSGSALMPLTCAPAPGAACSPGTVTATWQYYNTASNPPALQTGTFTTQVGSNGSFAFTAVPPGEGIVSPNFDLQVTAGGFSPFGENNVAVPSCPTTNSAGTAQGACRPGYLVDVPLSPLASAVDAKVVLRTGPTSTGTSSADLSRVSVLVERENGAGAGIRASVNGSGQLVWDDPSAGQRGWAEPGVYKLVFSLPGFSTSTVDKLVVPVDLSCSAQPCATINVGTITLTKTGT